MPVVLYFVVLLIAAGSVAFSLDWMSAPLALRTKPRTIVHASAPQDARALAPLRARASRVSETKAKDDTLLSPVFPASPKADADARPENASEDASRSSVTPFCDVNACTNAYRSFRASDCTYQPYEGERRLCKKGNPPVLGRDAAVSGAMKGYDALAADERAPIPCNVAACARAYSSFDASSCTYQPYDGPRRLCRK